MSQRRTKTYGWTCFAAASAILWAASAAEARSIGVILSTSDTFIGMLHDGIESSAGKLDSVEIKFQNAEGDADRQLGLLKDMVGSGVDAVVIIPVDGDQGVEMSKIALQAGIPLVYLNSQPVHVDELPAGQTYVGSDENDSGTLQAREVCRRLGGKGRVVVMMGELLHFAARMRTTDIDRVLAEPACSGLEIVERQSANWSRSQAATLVGEWLDAGVGFDAVIANNDEMALGAIAGLKRTRAWNDRILVAGIDATKDGLSAIKAGDMQVTILQNAKGQGEAALDAALSLADRKSVPAKIHVPFELVTSDNVDSYLAAR